MSLVLLIDNEPKMETLVSMCLLDVGARVVVAGDLAQALTIARRERPNVVLLDLDLGQEDGIAILPSLRQEPALSGVPIIAFTVHGSREAEADDEGIDGFVVKPFKPARLRAVLEEFVG
jgi:DNA-binding response OmpR family regulator